MSGFRISRVLPLGDIALLAVVVTIGLLVASAFSQPTDAVPSPKTEVPEKAPDQAMPPLPDTPAPSADRPTPTSDERRSSGLYGDITNIGLRRTLVLITAFLIGMCGAAAFHLGVFLGFIARDSRTGLLEFLHIDFANRPQAAAREIWIKRCLRFSFWIFGGIVATVFQMADADSLVPIQAFVLGASWPSVVTQLMSGRSTPPPQPANVSPPPPPAPPPQGAAATAGAGQAPGGQAVEVIT
jgi:hypothetical protein